MRRQSLFMILFPILVLAACANPAADAPQAEVSEPVVTDTMASTDDTTTTVAVLPIDTEQSSIEFVGSKVTGSHDGGFEQFSGEVELGETITDSAVRVVIDTQSLWSDNERLTGHLKSEDFFEVETYPEAVFESTEITESPDGGYELTGNLTLHGVTKQISFPAEITRTDDAVTANAEFAIKRFDFDIVYPGRPDDLIRDDVLVRLDLVAK